MITAGIDVGVERTKAVVIEGGKILGRGIAVSGGVGRNDAAKSALAEAMKEAGMEDTAVERTAATGKGRYDVSFAEVRPTEVVAYTKAAKHLCPEATTVVDFGADEILAAVLGEDGRDIEVVYNQKCSAGLGIFLRTMARRLGLTLDDMSQADVSGDAVEVPDGCVVFAELGALSMLNHGRSVSEVAGAVTKAAAVRAATVLNDIILPNNDKVIFTGGLTKNNAFMKALYQRYGLAYTIPKDTEYAGALGAALIAAE